MDGISWNFGAMHGKDSHTGIALLTVIHCFYILIDCFVYVVLGISGILFVLFLNSIGTAGAVLA